MKSALITGGSKGIGYATAEALIREGYGVTITARNAAEVEAAAKALGENALGVVCDVRDPQAVQDAVQRHAERFGGLDFLFANAGVGHFAPVQDLTLEQWQQVIDTNLTGVFYSVKFAFEHLKASGGYVITLSSLAGKNPFAGGAAYNASKFGLNGFTEAIMLDLRAHGIKVSQIMPGSVSTHFNGHTPSDADAWKIQPEDVAQIVVDLLNMHPRTLPSRVEVRPAQPAKR
ncbi:SDR family oxidoreductase [Deinococcus maricopensis]|uniref:3-oxoacyl-(Acyl-carrier-protein) reductase n=1 Tax=Deinococcus maricopensis (strain DSM 21211 / LMG 22137 / NRRL B-23946 / LB-34) TaxID=709986 RepID=E8U7Y8_DEIML|nr:SDR family oxidoreductase [Deinococcus maricopensis]ADV67177.1 3-oxoacyl-(acyl-carrier-protein) reductase [Deinococcus maricopensis DSM 21211]